MEELLVYAILFYEDIITEEQYQKELDKLFLKNPSDEMLLYLEWETDIKKAIIFIRTHINYQDLSHDIVGTVLMEQLRIYYYQCQNIQKFANKMYSLWESLPGDMQNKQPFEVFCYIDDPLSWGEEKEVRFLYEQILNYYKKS